MGGRNFLGVRNFLGGRCPDACACVHVAGVSGEKLRLEGRKGEGYSGFGLQDTKNRLLQGR